MNARIIWIIVIVVLVVVLAAGGLVALGVFAIFKVMDRTDSHVCGLAYVQKSAAAQELLGTPIAQRGLTGGNSNDTNGDLKEHITFNVFGPKGEAHVIADGERSQLGSHLDVRFGRDQQSQTAYSGPLDCPELHAK
jgi:hypothetical protein